MPECMMSEYEEHQSDEIEVLESIYHDSFEVLGKNPWSFKVKVTLEEDDLRNNEEENSAFEVDLRFEYTEKYPDEPPVYEILSTEGLEEEDNDRINELIEEQIEENLGMVMVFTIVSAIQEFLNATKDQIKQNKVDEKERLEKELEQEEQKKFQGTRVTVENFMKWKEEFENYLLDKNKELFKLKEKEKKLMTGKEIFMSGIKIPEDEILAVDGEVVEVDESLFEDLEDLDFEEEELET